MIKAIIFDLDGVLIDGADWHYLAFNKALQSFGYSISRQEHERLYNGLPTRKKLEYLSKEKGLPTFLHGAINKLKQEYTRELIESYCKPDPEKINLLKKLEEKGYRLAVCSNAVRLTVETMLKKSRIDSYFDFLLSNEDIDNPKPDPEIYLKSFEKLGLNPDECLIVEDSESGKKAAYTSGARVLEIDNYNNVNFDLIDNFIKNTMEE